MSIESLFRNYCRGNKFAHDSRINNLLKREMQRSRKELISQTLESYSSNSASPMDQMSPNAPHSCGPRDTITIAQHDDLLQRELHALRDSKTRDAAAGKSLAYLVAEGDDANGETESQDTKASSPALSIRHSSARREAYERMIQNYRGIGWNSIELISAGCNHSIVEKEL